MMADHPDMETLLKQNPRATADPARLERLRGQVAELRKKGITPKGYDLSSPFGSKLWLNKGK